MKIIMENVSKYFGNICVLDSINMSLESSLVYGLEGVNGSGKTMLLRMICGLIHPTKGKIWIGKYQLHREISFPESIGILIEDPAFIDECNGYQNLHLLAQINKKVSDKNIESLLSLVGLSYQSKKKYKNYSLGMKQRLGIAAAIMEKPQILLLDEPTNALDAQGVNMLKKIIKQAKNNDSIVVISSHDSFFLKEVADKVYNIENGRIINEENI